MWWQLKNSAGITNCISKVSSFNFIRKERWLIQNRWKIWQGGVKHASSQSLFFLENGSFIPVSGQKFKNVPGAFCICCLHLVERWTCSPTFPQRWRAGRLNEKCMNSCIRMAAVSYPRAWGDPQLQVLSLAADLLQGVWAILISQSGKLSSWLISVGSIFVSVIMMCQSL